MNKGLALIALVVCCTLSSYGQSLFRVEGQKALFYKHGYTKLSPFTSYELGYSVYKTDKISFITSIDYEHGTAGLSDYFDIRGKIGSSYNVFDLADRVYFNPYFGLQVGYESVNNPEIGNKGALIYGVDAGLDVEVFLVDRFALYMDYKQSMILNHLLGRWHYRIGFGIKYHF